MSKEKKKKNFILIINNIMQCCNDEEESNRLIFPSVSGSCDVSHVEVKILVSLFYIQ